MNDGFSIPLNNLAEILPVSQTDDYIFKLFQQVITFEGIEELCRSRKPVVIKYNEKSTHIIEILPKISYTAYALMRLDSAEAQEQRTMILLSESLTTIRF